MSLDLYRLDIMLKEITTYELLGLFDSYNSLLCKISQKLYFKKIKIRNLGYEIFNILLYF